MKKILFIAIVGTMFMGHNAYATVPSWDIGLSGAMPFISFGIGTAEPGWFVSKEKSISGDLSIGTLLGNIVPSWDGLVKTVANMMITMLKEAMLDWVRNGFDAGGPLFVQNPSQFFGEAVDEATGGFIAELGKTVADDPNFFCRNFAPQIIFNYGSSFSQRRPRAQCTLSDVAANIEDVADRFENYGWDGFVTLQQDNNNPLGLQLMLFREQMARAEVRFKDVESESNWGQGYKTVRECADWQEIPAGDGGQWTERICKSWKTKTLGAQIGDRVAKTVGLDFEGLQLADEISEFIGELVNLAIREALEAGLSG